MRRITLLLTIFMLFVFASKAQLVQITNETFETTLSGWTITPSASWKPDTNLYAGGQTSYRGVVPMSNQAGDTSILISPIYNLTSYAYVWLTFNQICKVSASDICQIEYRENYIGSPWQAIPTSSYQGSGNYTNARFSHESYSDWQPSDSLATPTNSWWKTEHFDISDEVSYSQVQFRFKITRGSVLGTYFVYGWLIDNFQINASVNPIAPPIVEFITTYSDTVYNTGPFLIKAKAATRTIAPLLTPTLYYSATIGGIPTNDSIVMTAFEGDSIWTATIPQHIYGTTINYVVVATDSVGNTNNANGGFYINRPAGVVDSNAVALHSIDNPTEGTVGGLQPVKVTIKNKGIDYLDSCVINWTVNGVLQSPVVWRGHIVEDFNDTITLGYYTQRYNMFDTVVVWVDMPNGVLDTTTSDDTLNVVSYGCYGPINGDFIVGTAPGANVPSIYDAFFIGSVCGVSGDVTLKLQNATYAENWDFTNLADIMGNYTLTVTSLSGNRDSVILKPASGVGITLNNTDNFIIKDITIDNTINNDYGIEFTGTADNVEIRNIHFIGDKTGTSSTTSPAPIYKTSGAGLVDDVRFIGNTIEGGYYGIYFYAGTGTSAYGTNVVFDSNTIFDQYYYATYFYYTDFSSVSYNAIYSRTLNAATTWYGLRLYNCDFVANANRIHAKTSFATFYGVYFYNSGTVLNPSLFANNEIIGITSSTYYGIYSGSTSFVDIINNSIHMSGSGASRNIYIANNTGANYTIKNNLLVNTSSGYPIYFSGSTTPFTSDYNCLYGNSNIGYITSARTSLSAWQSATGQDANSISVNPSFMSVTSNLKLTNYVGFDCYMIPNVNRDIEGTVRTMRTSMGCYTAPLVSSNGSIAEILHLDMPAHMGDTSLLEVVFLNAGLDTIHTATINWSINNVLQPTVNWTGSLASQKFDTLSLGSIIYQNGFNYVDVWLSGIGALTDSVSYDDSLQVYSFACYDSLSGDFIVGKYSGADVQTLNVAVYIAGLCGVNGDVTLKLQNDTYIENWNLTDLNNIMGSHALIITSLSGKRDSVIIRPSSGDAIVFNNTNNVNINNITLDAINGYNAINFTGASSNILIENCNINASPTASTNTYSGIYKPSSVFMNGLTIRKCNIDGGYYGVYIVGTSSAYDQNITIDSNIFANQYYYGIYLQYVNSKSTSYNCITPRSLNSGVNWYGIWVNYNRNGGNIIGNRIYADNSNITTNLYGMRTYYIDSALVANNEIILNSTASTTYGIYIDYPKAVDYVHNSILLTGTSNTARAAFWYVYSNTTYDASMMNNIFITNTSGTTPYAIYLSGTYSSTYAANYRIDYNNYYSSGNLGYVGGAKLDLSSWQTTVITDMNSVSVYPSFVDSSLNLKLNDYSALACPKYPGVDNDIDDNMRINITTMGCYTPVMSGADGALTEVLNWKTSAVYVGDTSHLKVVLLNAGATTITAANIRWKFNNVAQPVIHWTGSLAMGTTDTIDLDTVTYISRDNDVMVWIGSLGALNDTTQINDTVRANNYACDSMLNGYYTIGATGDYADMDEAVAILNLCGINGPVTFAIQPGTYLQNTTIGYINGTSPTNTITFTSTTGDSTDVVLQRADNATTSIAPIMITNGENIIIEKVTLSGQSPITSTYTYSHGIIITGTSRNIEVRNCHIYGPKNFGSAVTGTNQNPVRLKDATVSDVRILNNLIEGGSCGVYVYGTNSTSRISNVVVKGNTIGYVDTYGFYVYYADSVLIEGNTLVQRTGNFTPGIMYGVYNYYANSDIISNKLKMASTYYGIYTYYMNNDTSIRHGLIVNNEIIGNATTTTHRGIYMNSYTRAKVYHNSIYMGGSAAGSGIYVTSSAYTYVDIKNNNIVMNVDEGSDPYPIYLGSITYLGTQWTLNYNNYYNENGTNIGYAGGAKTSLAAWQATVSMDINSVSVNPNFLDISSSMMLLDSNGLSCPRLPLVLNDIQDSSRSSLTTMGAYHFEPARVDVLPLTFTTPSTTVAVGVTTPITVTFVNNGLDTITSFMVGCKVNGIAITPTSFTGSLASGDSTTILLGSFTPQSYENSIVVYTYLPNGQPDQFKINDTISMEAYGCDSMLNGTYTIGTTGDFTSIDKAIKAIENCGISASVIFEIQNGTYTNHLSIGQIPGSSDTNTVTFLSQARDASSVIINVANTAIRLNDAANLNFRYLTVYGSVIGVDIVGSCTNVEFYACTLSTYASSNNSMYRVVNYANTSGSGNYLKDVRFIKNTLSGGYYSMYLYYAGSSSTDMENCLITIDSNTMVDAYYYGIYSYYYAKYKSISYNTVIMRSSTSTQYGIYTYYTTIDDGMIGNRVVTNASSTNYGMRLYYINSYAADGLALIANNEVICNGGSSTIYGLYCYYNTAKIYHNSISVSGTGNAYALYIGSMSSSYQMDLYNNIFASSSTGTPYGIYVGTSSNATQSSGTYLDYNDYYSSGSDLGYIGSAMNSLSALRSATGQDNNSINVNPNFVSAGDLNLTSYAGFDCPRMPEVDRDIQNYIRKNTTSMGAYVKEPSNIDAELVDFVGFSEAYASAGSHPISVIVRNSGFNPIASAVITGKVNNVDIAPITFTPSSPLLFGDADTVSIGSYVFVSGINDVMAAVTLTGDTLQDNDTIHNSRYMCTFIVGGDYVIGSSPTADYPTVDSLMADVLRCGINSDITLKFESGTYTGSWDLLDLGYFLGNYTLTVTSLANHRDSVVFTNTSGVLVNLNNTHNVKVKHITLDATAGTYAVEFTGDASNIVFDSCKILASPTSTATSYAAIYKASSTGYLDGLTIKNSLISGGYYGVYLYGESSLTTQRVILDSNIITDQYYYGVYYYYVNSISTSYNYLTPRAVNQNTLWYGMRLYQNKNGGNVVGNRIYADNSSITGTIYGLYIYYIDSALVANNDIYLNSSASTTYGIYLDYPKGCNILHNSVLIDGTSNNARAIYWYVYSNDTYDATLKNNIFVSNSSGTTPYAIYLSGTYSSSYAHNYRIDYNNYYSTGNLGYVGSAQSTLANWQSIVVPDQHSTFSLPSFINVNQDLRLADYSAYTCPLIADMPYDRANITRHMLTSKGAYEMVLLDVDASLRNFDTTNLIYNQTSPVTVTLLNSGLDTLTSASIHWTFNGVAQTPYSWNGSVSTFTSSIVNIGNVIPLVGMNHIVAWVSNPNNSTDSNTLNDTIYLDVYACTGTFSGVYTVGNSSADFADINEAIDALNLCGISGDVTLSVLSGRYDGFNINGIVNGANDTTIVTITSAAAHADSVVFEGGPALTLNNSAYLAFSNVTFDARTGGYAVAIIGNTDNVEISHCNIYADPNATASSAAGIYKGSTGIANNVRIIGNTIDGGYYGVYFYGGTSSSIYGYNNVVDSNLITNQYYYATYFYYAHFNSVSYNTMLSRTSNTSTYWYGIRLYYTNFVVQANRIHQRATAITSPYLVYIYYASYNNAVSPSVFANNEVIGYSSTTYYGLYLGSSNLLDVYNNSIYLDATAGARSIYIASSTTSSYDIKNNIVVNTSTSGYPIYFDGTTTPFTSDYNCFYGAGNVGYIGSSQSTLAAWKTATSQDAHSISINPPFVNASNNLELIDYSAFIVPKLSDVSVDINGINRTILTMMGAYSKPLFEGYNLELTDIISPKAINDVYCFDDYTDVRVVLKNAGIENYYFDTNNITLHLDVSGVYNYQFDTLINVGSMLASKKDTFDIMDMLPVSLPGTYHISIYLSSSVDTMYDDDTLRLDYTVNKIELPYDVDFSSQPSELILRQVQGIVNWEVEAGTGSNPVIAPVFGTGRLTFASESGIGSVAQVILNGLDLRGMQHPKLEFWYAHDASSTQNDFIRVKMSTDGGASTQVLQTIYRYDAAYTTPGWVHYVVDLSDYDTNACVSIVFEANSFGGANQNIDRIRIASEQDIALSLIAPKEEDLIACNLDNQTLQVVIENMSSQVIDFDVDTTQIELKVSGANTLFYTYPLSGKLIGNVKDTLLITPSFDLSIGGTYNLVAYIQAIDTNSINDTAKTTIIINPDLSIENIVGVDDVNCKFIGDSVYVSFDIINSGNLVVNEIPLRLQINNANDIIDTIYTLMNVGDTLTYHFTQAYVVPVVTESQPYYIVTVKTELGCDADQLNNRKNITACVEIPEVVDLQLQSINKPIETLCDSGLHIVNVSVTLENAGTNDITAAVVHVEVDSVGVILASFSEVSDAILSGSTLTHVFTQGYHVPNFSGNYTVKVFVEAIADDEDLTNDTLVVNACAILNDVGIDDITEISWILGQNIPNPAKSLTSIPYVVPQNGEVIFTVMSINGQILYREVIQTLAGSHRVELNTDKLSNGMYYYSMEYKGQRIVKKMTIQR